jgi:hypothetical protein
MISHLNELDEIRPYAVQHTTIIQQQMMKWHGKFIKKRTSNQVTGIFSLTPSLKFLN